MKLDKAPIKSAGWWRTKALLQHPATFIVLVWVLLCLAFYVITEFI